MIDKDKTQQALDEMSDNYETIKAALTQLEALQWRPISEASKEVTRMVAWDGGSVEVIEYGENWCSHGCYEPTHFIPLSALPGVE